MKHLLVALLALNTVLNIETVQAQDDYQAGTLEALGYLNEQWVNKPQQRAHERDLMRIKSQGYQRNALDSFDDDPRLQVQCHIVPVYSFDGSVIGHRKACY